MLLSVKSIVYESEPMNWKNVKNYSVFCVYLPKDIWLENIIFRFTTQKNIEPQRNWLLKFYYMQLPMDHTNLKTLMAVSFQNITGYLFRHDEFSLRWTINKYFIQNDQSPANHLLCIKYSLAQYSNNIIKVS